MDNCTCCKGRGGILPIVNGKICSLCLNYLKHKAGYTQEDLYELDNEIAIKVMTVTKQTEKVLLEEQRANKGNSSKTSQRTRK